MKAVLQSLLIGVSLVIVAIGALIEFKFLMSL